MTRIVVVGYGNPLRADDGLGWAAARLLEERVDAQRIRVLTEHQLTPELAETFSEADLAILIDAQAAGTPGEISTRTIEPDPTLQASNHFSDPSAILAMADDLYGHAPLTFIVSVPGWDFDYRDSLSPRMSERIPAIVDTVLNLIENETD